MHLQQRDHCLPRHLLVRRLACSKIEKQSPGATTTDSIEKYTQRETKQQKANDANNAYWGLGSCATVPFQMGHVGPKFFISYIAFVGFIPFRSVFSTTGDHNNLDTIHAPAISRIIESACGEEQSTCNGLCFWAPARQFSTAQCLGRGKYVTPEV